MCPHIDKNIERSESKKIHGDPVKGAVWFTGLVSVVGQRVSERFKGAKKTNSENHEANYRV